MTTANLRIVQSALAAVLESGDASALSAFLHDDFVHHRPGSSTQKAEWIEAVRAVPLARLRVEVHHMLSDGDHVVMHATRSLAGSGALITGVDLWRLQDGLIVEGWEILESAPAASANTRWWQPPAPGGTTP